MHLSGDTRVVSAGYPKGGPPPHAPMSDHDILRRRKETPFLLITIPLLSSCTKRQEGNVAESQACDIHRMRLQSLLRRLDAEEEEACGIAQWSHAHVHLIVSVDVKWKSGI